MLLRCPGDGGLGQLGHEHRLLLGPAHGPAVPPGPACESPLRAVHDPGQRPGQPLVTQVPAPCTNCRITDMVPNLVFDGSGATANLDNGMLLHHFVLFNPNQTGIGCPISEPFYGCGQRAHATHLPTPFGYTNTAPNWNMNIHVVNKSATPRMSTSRSSSAGGRCPRPPTRGRCGWTSTRSAAAADSEYTIPTGLLRHARELDRRRQDGRIIDMAGTCTTSTSSTRTGARCTAPSAAVRSRCRRSSWADPPARTTDRSRRTTRRRPTSRGRRCAGRRPTTAPRSAPRTAATATSTPMSHCGIFTDMPAGRQAEAYPAGAEYPERRHTDHHRPDDQAPQRVPERLGQHRRRT